MRFAIILCVIILAVLVINMHLKTQKPFVSVLSSGMSGILAFFGMNLISAYTGVVFAANAFNIALSVILGVPGVAFMTYLKIRYGV